MRKKILTSYSFIVLFHMVISLQLCAQNISFEKLTPQDGLSQIDVMSIHQDSRGYLWFCTQDGLNRFDGYDFKIYNQSEEALSLSSNLFIDITEDNERNLWIATQDKGLNIYNTDYDKITQLANSKENPKLISDNQIYKVFCDSKNRIWIVTYKGVDCIIKNNDSITVNTITERIHSKVENSLYGIQIYETQCGDILITTYQGIAKIEFSKNGMPNGQVSTWFFQEELGEYNFIIGSGEKYLLATTTGIYALKSISGKKVAKKVSPINVSQMIFDAEGNLWAGGHDGLYYFEYFENDDSPLRLKHHAKYGREKHNITGNFIRKLYFDNQQNLWIGIAGGGAYKYNVSKNQFRWHKNTNKEGSINSNSIQTIYEDKEGNLWIGTQGGGINFLSKTENRNYDGGFQYYYATTQKNLNYTYEITEIEQNNKTMIMSGNAYRPLLQVFDKNKSDWKQTSIENPFQSFICGIKQDQFNYIWIATYGDGLYKALYKDGKYIFWHFNKENSGIPSDIVRNIFEDSKHRLWIGTDDGLMLIDNYYNDSTLPPFYTFKRDKNNKLSLSENYILKVLETYDNEIWIGTLGRGINIFIEGSEKKGGSFEKLTTKNGLPNNVIGEMIEDLNRDIWIATNKGICRFNRKDSSTHNYSVNNGLQGNAFQDRAGCLRKDGEILLGGPKGFNSFYPDEIKLDSIPPVIVFNSFELLNRKVLAGDSINGRILIEKSINEIEEITLMHKENNFTIHFSALNYIAPENNQYKYILSGFDTEWTSVSTNARFAKYTNLNPGTYTFKIKASNSDGTWTKEPKQIVIKVKLPFWETPLFIISLISFVVIIVIALYYVRLRSVKKQNKILEQKVKKRTHEIQEQSMELAETNVLLEEQKEEVFAQKEKIHVQNTELQKHRTHLEKLVSERTQELNKALIKAKESGELKTAFLANMSHEIRTPMNAIIGFTDLLGLDDLSDEEQADFIQLIQSNSKVLLKLIDDILDLSLIEANQIRIHNETFNVSDFLEQIIATYKTTKQQSSVDFKLSIPDSLYNYTILNDETRIKQVLTNFIDNAIKFTEKGYIRLGAKLLDDEVVFYVEDTGQGIPDDQIEYIFHRFTKLEGDSLNWHQGLGLGLAISYKIATTLGGTIQVESESNVGSIFSFHLPIE